MSKTTKQANKNSLKSERSSPARLQVWTGYLLHWVHEQAKAAYTRESFRLHLSPHQIGILQALSSEGPVVQARLGERLRIDKGALSGELSNLESQGLVVKKRHATDLRSVVVHLLEPGRKRAQAAEEINAKVTKHFFAALSEQELQALHEILQKIATANDDAAD